MKTIIITLLPLIGVLFGWGLTQITNLFNVYLSDRRILKETFYFLLELYYQISTVKKIDEGAEAYIKTLNSSIPNFISSQIEYEQALLFIKKVITDFNNPRIEMELQELNENYDKCLLKLASVDPINAYKLKGRNKIVSYLSQWNNYSNETIMSNPTLIADPNTTQFTEIIKPKVESNLIGESLEDLKEITKEIAIQIGGKTKREFDKLTIFSSTENNSEIDETLKKYVEKVIIPAIKKMQGQ